MPKKISKAQQQKSALRLKVLAFDQAGLTRADIATATGLHRSTIIKIIRRAKEKGFDPKKKERLNLDHVLDKRYDAFVLEKSHSGRPRKGTPFLDIVLNKSCSERPRKGTPYLDIVLNKSCSERPRKVTPEAEARSVAKLDSE